MNNEERNAAERSTRSPGGSLRSISFVIPVYNEAENIAEVIDGILGAVSQSANPQEFEIIVVDDGSTDRGPAVLDELGAKHPHLKVITLRKNFGKSAALMAGFDQANGEVVITLDGDCQDDPAEIPRFLEKLEEGYDLVSGWKKERRDPLEKRITSRIFNSVVSRVTGVPLHDMNCGFKAYRAWCLRNIALTGNLYRFLPVLVAQRGGRLAEIQVRHHPRKSGESKFGLKRYLEGILDLCTVILLSRFFQKPLYFFGLIGLPLILLGGTIGLYLVGGHIYYLLSGDVQYELLSRPLLQISITLFGIGLHIFLIGLLAELILSRLPDKGYSIKHRR
jgi:glycosyltransferase involved in cell wall biosynthesis